MAKRKRNGIMCLETIWFDELNPSSTRYILELLRLECGMPSAYRDVSTHEELDYHLGRWVGRNTFKKDYVLSNYGILYLGFHGGPGKILLREDLKHRGDDDDEVPLDQIAESLLEGNPTHVRGGSVIHFSSCSVLRSSKRVEEFKELVGVTCVSGYTKSVNSTLSWAFELMYLSALHNKNLGNPNVMLNLKMRIESKPEYAGLAEHLGFQMIV